MKKLIAAAAALAAVSAFSVSAFADAYVTISDETGKIVVAMMPVGLTDNDDDGNITVNDVLISAHDEFYADGNGSAEESYATAESDYGPMITKLWGVENGGAYGYYINNVAGMSLNDPIKDNDHLYAFIYTDTQNYSDKYTYFDQPVSAYEGIAPDTKPSIELHLNAAAFDENWSPVTVPVEGATITINDEKTDFVTDSTGTVTVDLPGGKDGLYIISAVSDTETIVPPITLVKVVVDENAKDNDIEDNGAQEVAAPETGAVDAAADSSKGSPDTGIADVAAVAGIAVIAAGAFIVSKNRK